MKSQSVFRAARKAWESAAKMRADRVRFKNFTYGKQWNDIVRTPSGEYMTEGQYAEQSGKQPLTNNMIRQLIKSIVGRFRHSLAEGTTGIATPDDRFKAIAEANCLDEIDSRLLEEFLISGCAVQRIVRERRPGSRAEVWVDNVSPGAFFVNRFSDPRGSDINLIGMLHDMTLNEVLMRFGHGDSATVTRLADIYSTHAGLDSGATSPALGDDYSRDFKRAPSGMCRVVEVWALECDTLLRCHDSSSATLFDTPVSDSASIDEINRQRADEGRAPLDTRAVTSLQWHGYYFSPDGSLLDHTVSPYPHGSHPFVVKFYPLLDGEVHPFVEDIIDQQRYINRLITLIDLVIGFSAKGVLLFPTEQKPDGLSWEQISRMWCTPNGVIPYNGLRGNEPRQVYSSGNVAGAHELLGMEMKLFEQISGVSSALRGQTPGGNTSATLYESQIQNAAISLADIFETFNSFRSQRNRLILAT